MNEEFAAVLRQLMDSHNMSGAELGRRLGMTHKSVVSRWRSGRDRPAAETVVRIADLFGYDRYALLQLARWLPGEPQPQPDPRRLVRYRQLDAWLNAVGAMYEAFFWEALKIQAELTSEIIRGVTSAVLGMDPEPAISTHEIGPLACSCLFCRPPDPGVAGGPSEPLAILLSLPLAS